jgi:hypothetical protein
MTPQERIKEQCDQANVEMMTAIAPIARAVGEVNGHILFTYLASTLMEMAVLSMARVHGIPERGDPAIDELRRGWAHAMGYNGVSAREADFNHARTVFYEALDARLNDGQET